MDEAQIYNSLEQCRRAESDRILKFLGGLTIHTFFFLVLLTGLFGEERAWRIYFVGIFLLVVWLAFAILRFESRISELREKIGEKNI